MIESKKENCEDRKILVSAQLNNCHIFLISGILGARLLYTIVGATGIPFPRMIRHYLMR